MRRALICQLEHIRERDNDTCYREPLAEKPPAAPGQFPHERTEGYPGCTLRMRHPLVPGPWRERD